MNLEGDPFVPKRVGIFRRIAVQRYSEPQVGDTPWVRPRVRATAAVLAIVLALAGSALLAG